jgi:ATP-dependent exoDNAse (exonuclease V) beta subunit
VWWDPAALRLGVDANFGLRQKEVLQERGGSGPSESLQRHEAWRARREAVLRVGTAMTVEPFTASEAAAAPPEFECEVRLEAVARAASRPAGPRFGALVHEVLREAALAAGETEIRAAARVRGRVLGAREEEIEAAVEAVRAALAHPLLERARAAELVQREYPVMLRLDGGKILEGVIDLAFLERGAWTVVDFKTDADLPARRAQYERQLRWYALAMERITGSTARAVLMAV